MRHQREARGFVSPGAAERPFFGDPLEGASLAPGSAAPHMRPAGASGCLRVVAQRAPQRMSVKGFAPYLV